MHNNLDGVTITNQENVHEKEKVAQNPTCSDLREKED